MSTSDLVAYVQQLPIDDDDSPAVPTTMPQRNRRSTGDNGPEMIGNVPAVFAPGLSPENRRRAENCILFAQLAASKQVSKNQAFEYSDVFYNILSNIGWYTLSHVTDNRMSNGFTGSLAREFIDILKNSIRRGIMPVENGQFILLYDQNSYCYMFEI